MPNKYKKSWDRLIQDAYPKKWEQDNIKYGMSEEGRDKLFRVRFTKDGRMIKNYYSHHAKRHFPNLIKLFREKMKS